MKELTLNAKLNRTVLSGKCLVRKTEVFLKNTAKLLDGDLFFSKVADAIILSIASFGEDDGDNNCYKVVTADRKNTLYFAFGRQVGKECNPLDIIFFRYETTEGELYRNDMRLTGLLASGEFSFYVRGIIAPIRIEDFSKLYRLSGDSGVTFPLLNKVQREIVNIENRNVLVQGAAGSGKTNVCIDKIIFTACKEYGGRVLYTTFSRGLLVDTANRLNVFRRNIDNLCKDYKDQKVIFADAYRKKALENKLGVYIPSDDEEGIMDKLTRISKFLAEKVDYMLIEDLYATKFGRVDVADEKFFNNYLVNPRNKATGNLEKVKNLSKEVLFKEIYGMIGGFLNPENPNEILDSERYMELRKESFRPQESKAIFTLGEDYYKYLVANGKTDNNLMSKALLSAPPEQLYSLVIADEVQDMTQVNLCCLRSLGRRFFAVGDALQMINPSYFSFAYLKRLLFRKEIGSSAEELSHNYRSTAKIAEIVNSLGELNASVFGTHSFVIKGKSVETSKATAAVYIKDKGFYKRLADGNFDNFTIIVGSQNKKAELRKIFKKQEILTVSEIKGLERDTVVLADILTDNDANWQTLLRSEVNRKNADENSVYRYYFNLFYVGLSRARSNLYVVDSTPPLFFKEFFENNFDVMTAEKAYDNIIKVLDKQEIDQDELLDRVNQFIKLEQYDNARFTAEKLGDGKLRHDQLAIVDAYDKYVKHGNYRQAGVDLWQNGVLSEAKKMFELSGDTQLIDLMDMCLGGEESSLNYEIADFYPDLEGNDVAKKLIIDTIKKDLQSLRTKNKETAEILKRKKEKR